MMSTDRATTPARFQKALSLLDDFFREIDQQAKPLAEDRAATQTQVHKVVSTIEGKLYRVLNGQILRGCPNLLTHDRPVYGYNVRKQQKSAKIQFPEADDDIVETLILTREGAFAIVEVTLDPLPPDRSPAPIQERLRAEFMDPEPDDIQIEDLYNILQTVVEACIKHVLHSQKTDANTKRVRELADSVLDALLDPTHG